MKERIDFGCLTSLDLKQIGKNTPYDRARFMNWLIATQQPMCFEHAKNLSYSMNVILRDSDTLDITEEQATAFAAQIMLSKWSKSNKRVKLIALEYYMEYIGKKVHFKKPKATNRNICYLTEEQMRHLIMASMNYRDAAIIELLCSTGIRIGELRQLNLNDIDLVNKVIHVRHGKGDKEREVYLTNECEQFLLAYVSRWKVGDGPLFCSRLRQRISIKALESIVSKTASMADLPRTTPHMLRHSYATCFAGKNPNILVLQELLGHSTIEMTQRYYHSNRETNRKGALIGAPTMLTHG